MIIPSERNCAFVKHAFFTVPRNPTRFIYPGLSPGPPTAAQKHWVLVWLCPAINLFNPACGNGIRHELTGGTTEDRFCLSLQCSTTPKHGAGHFSPTPTPQIKQDTFRPLRRHDDLGARVQLNTHILFSRWIFPFNSHGITSAIGLSYLCK